ncbi:MAG: 3-deoxy-7-phosphoheptulonate synthase, partial [Dehalococcoidia bacterium]|nr:3-deoxy-7-phosphoheptulonate synthase [Dehalococcoidia bacterium]
MIIVMESGVSQAKIDAVLKRVRELGLEGHVSVGVERTVIGVVGYTPMEIREPLEQLAGVEEVLVVGKPFKLA